MGDPAGIGGELTVRAWHALHRNGPCFVALDDPQRLIGAPIIEVIHLRGTRGLPDRVACSADRIRRAGDGGQPDKANAKAVIASIERAAALCLSGEASGMVTNPINKAALYDAGFAYPGHTEFLAALTGAAGKQIMMLASPDLRVVPVTVHASLRNSIAMLTTTPWSPPRARPRPRCAATSASRSAPGGCRPQSACRRRARWATRRHRSSARRSRRCAPTASTCPARGRRTMFTRTARARYDVAICMYHDQALIPLKTLDMDHGVNVTLGLPIVRTSPDHGTAYDIAGKGIADPSSLIAAIELAAELAERRAGIPAGLTST